MKNLEEQHDICLYKFQLFFVDYFKKFTFFISNLVKKY